MPRAAIRRQRLKNLIRYTEYMLLLETEMTAYRRLLTVIWTAHRTNASLLQKYNHRNACWQLYGDVSSSISTMWSEQETCAPKYWKEDSLVREDEVGRGEDWEMISRTGQTEQWPECSRLARDMQQWRLLVH